MDLEPWVELVVGDGPDARRVRVGPGDVVAWELAIGEDEVAVMRVEVAAIVWAGLSR